VEAVLSSRTSENFYRTLRRQLQNYLQRILNLISFRIIIWLHGTVPQENNIKCPSRENSRKLWTIYIGVQIRDVQIQPRRVCCFDVALTRYLRFCLITLNLDLNTSSLWIYNPLGLGHVFSLSSSQEFLAIDPEIPGSIPYPTRCSENYGVLNGVHSASWEQLRSYLNEKVAAPVYKTEINGGGNSLRWPRNTLYPQKLALTSRTSGGLSFGIVRLRIKATEFIYYFFIFTLYTVGRTTWTGDQPVVRALPTHRINASRRSYL
jgi:hypothetical protein